MLKKLSPVLIMLASLCARIVYKGANAGDSLAFLSLCGLYGFYLYLDSKKEEPINEQLKKDLYEVRTAINALKIGRTFSNK